MKRPNASHLGLAAALASIPACWGGEAGAESPATESPAAAAIDPITVAVEHVGRESIVAAYSTSATLRAEKLATVTSRTRGVVEELFVEEGHLVTAGQTIAKLEDDEQVLAVGRYETSQEIKQREYERSLSLSEQRIISNNEVELLRREVEESRHDLELARLNLERTTISAPFDGIVVLRHLDVGATVNDGTPIFDLADLDPLYVDVKVPERHVGRLAPEQAVRLSADALDAPVQAYIERIAPIVDPTTGTVKVTVAVEHTVALRPGAYVEIDIVTDVHENALVVPRAALVAEGRRWLVFRAEEDGASVKALEVELGFEEDERIEVAGTLGGEPLEAGDRVVVLGASALSDGAPIRIMDRAPSSSELDDAPEEAAEEGAGAAAEDVAAARHRD